MNETKNLGENKFIMILFKHYFLSTERQNSTEEKVGQKLNEK